MAFDIFQSIPAFQNMGLDQSVDYFFDQLNSLGFSNSSLFAVPRCLKFPASSDIWGKTQLGSEAEALYRTELYPYDPVVKFFLDGGKTPLPWGRIKYTGRDKIIVDTFKNLGATNGLAIPFFGVNTLGVLCSCAPGTEKDHDDLLRRNGSMMYSLGSAFFQHIDMGGVVEEIYQNKGLSSKQIKFLKMLGLGLPDKVVAERMCVSLDGISYHKRKIKQKLDIDNIHDAAIIGVSQGWISA